MVVVMAVVAVVVVAGVAHGKTFDRAGLHCKPWSRSRVNRKMKACASVNSPA
jgi:hypothetical protein